jgi:hypothetical protein
MQKGILIYADTAPLNEAFEDGWRFVSACALGGAAYGYGSNTGSQFHVACLVIVEKEENKGVPGFMA